MVTKFEVLPNEILIQCFEYLNAPYLFYSFYQLNDRFNDLIRRIPLCINLKEDLAKSTFENFCTKISSNPGIKDQVYSLNLPLLKDNDPAGLRSKVFLSLFSLDGFSNLRNFKINTDVRIISTDMVSFDFNDKKMLEFSMVSFSKLRALSLSRLHERSTNLENIRLSITHLTLTECDIDYFYWLTTCAPMLEYLHVCRVYSFGSSMTKQTNESFPFFKKLIIDNVLYVSFNDFETLVKLTPNLKHLTISAIEMD